MYTVPSSFRTRSPKVGFEVILQFTNLSQNENNKESYVEFLGINSGRYPLASEYHSRETSFSITPTRSPEHQSLNQSPDLKVDATIPKSRLATLIHKKYKSSPTSQCLTGSPTSALCPRSIKNQDLSSSPRKSQSEALPSLSTVIPRPSKIYLTKRARGNQSSMVSSSVCCLLARNASDRAVAMNHIKPKQ